MYRSRLGHPLSLSRSFIVWVRVACGVGGAAVASLVLAAALVALSFLGAPGLNGLAALGMMAYNGAALSTFAGLVLVGILSGSLDSIFNPSSGSQLRMYRLVIRESVTVRWMISFWLVMLAGLVSAMLFTTPLGAWPYGVLVTCAIVCYFVLAHRVRKLSRVANTTPMYHGFTDEMLESLRVGVRLDNGPDWAPLDRIESASEAAAYQQLARERYLSFRLMAVLMATVASAFIASTAFWVLGQEPGPAVLVVFAPIAFVIGAQLVQLRAEQYDALSARYATRVEEFESLACL